MLKRFIELQKRVKAPKSEKNTYGQGFNYRNLEKMLNSSKSIFEEMKYSVRFIDEIVPFGERLFVKSTIVIRDEDVESDEHGNTEEAYGWAEIPLHLTSMSAPQITGSCSSYARKYAYCNLFAIDGSEDVDSLKQETTEDKVNNAIEAVKNAVKQATDNQDTEIFRNCVKMYWKSFGNNKKFKDAVDDGMNELGIPKAS